MPDTTYATASSAPCVMTTADGFVVVSWWRDKGNPVPPYKGTYSYEHFDTLGEAHECHREYEAGEWATASARGIFPVKDGLPFGPPLPLSQISAATQEARQDMRDDVEHVRLYGNGGL